MDGWSRFITRTWLFWLIAWPVAAVAVWVGAPRIPTLLADDATGFLPADVPSQRAFALLRDEFPAAAPASRAVVVCVRESGLTEPDRKWVAALARALGDRSRELGWHIHATATAPHLQSILESEDEQATIVAVDLPAEFLTHSTVNRVREIKRAIKADRPPDGLHVEVTGTGALGELLDSSAKGDINSTTLWAFVAVTVILLFIYRSPVAMLLPMVTITLSLMVSLGLLGRAAAHGLPINGLVEMFIIVILAGTGVDYCLFLFARFREALASDDDSAAAMRFAVAKSGGAILAGAGTNVVGLGTLALATNRDFYTTGPTIAAALVPATFAVLTLTPSMMRLVGRKLVWPGKLERLDHDGKLWTGVAGLVSRRPLVVLLVLLSLMLPTAWIAVRVEPSFDALEDYPADSSFVRGARLYSDHFHRSSAVSEQTLLVRFDERIDTPERLVQAREVMSAVRTALSERYHLLYQRDLQDPLGRRKRQAGSGEEGAVSHMAHGFVEKLAESYYVGRSGRTLRVDFAFEADPRAVSTLERQPELLGLIDDAVRKTPLAQSVGGALSVQLVGETPTYADIYSVRLRDFRVVAVAAILLVYIVLVGLLRAPLQACLLVAATLLTFLTTYGATWLIFRSVYDVAALSSQLDLILFIIILSLGQDYNIYVVARIREERVRRSLGDAVRTAVAKTGRVVSSCGLIMAAAFASMMSGSLLVMKEFAVALSLGILIDTFLVRPLLVPAAILLTSRWFNQSAPAGAVRASESAADRH